MPEPKHKRFDAPSLRQRLHSATGDRRAEAEALAERAGDAVAEDEAEIAVRAAHGDIRADVARTDDDPPELATTENAETVHERHIHPDTGEKR
jgi:hypothetical protein